MRILIEILLILTLSNSILGQNTDSFCLLKGRITLANQIGYPCIEVLVKQHDLRVQTNDEGYFIINIPKGLGEIDVELHNLLKSGPNVIVGGIPLSPDSIYFGNFEMIEYKFYDPDQFNTLITNLLRSNILHDNPYEAIIYRGRLYNVTNKTVGESIINSIDSYVTPFYHNGDLLGYIKRDELNINKIPCRDSINDLGIYFSVDSNMVKINYLELLNCIKK